jgi:hypothetical protein
MKHVKKLILEGEGAAACERFGGLLGEHPEKLRPATDLMIKVLEECCAQGLVESVQRFLEASTLLPPEAGDPIRTAMRARLERAGPWMERLDGITRERLARECRRHIVLKELKEAAISGAKLLDRASDGPQLDQNAKFLAHALSDLHHDRDRALQVVGAVPKAGGKVARAGGEHLASYFAEAVRLKADRGYDQGEQAWLRQLTEGILALADALPGINAVSEPGAEEMERFRVEVSAVLQAGQAQGRRDDLIDALAVIVDFCPIDESAIKNVAGIEDRMFVKLGPRARLTAVRTIREFGRMEQVREAVLDLAQSAEGKGRLKLLAGIMGGLGHGDFFPFLHRSLDHCAGKLEEAWVVDAISRLEHPKAAKLLLERLGAVMRKLGSREGLARADELFKALGRVTRLKGFDIEMRNKIVQHAIKLADGAERSVAFMAAERLFNNRPQELEHKLRAWAVRVAIEAMWAPPTISESSLPGGTFGWRQPMVTTLARQGNEMLPEMLEAAERHKTRYCGAMGALAGVLESVGDERAAPFMESMIQCALMHVEDPHRSRLLDEKVRDEATGALRELDRDDLLHGMFYSLLAFGGEPGLRVALDYADQIQAGRIPSPGEKTTTLLFDTKVKQGELGKVTKTARKVEIDDKAFKAALAEARGGIFSRNARRIAAMAALGTTRAPEAVEVLMEGLGDKDPLVASAAHTALGQYMHPLPAEAEFCRFWEAALERPKTLKGPLLERLQEFMRREMPKSPPYDKLFERQVEVMIEDEALAHQLRGAARKAESPRRVGAGAAGAEEEGEQDESLRNESEMDRKREYMMARRAWIEGGKKGPPPQPGG